MLITIGILTKNSEETIPYTLSSLLNLELPSELSIEIIVIDGYSYDRTLDIIAEYKYKFINIFGSKLKRFDVIQERVNTIGFARNIILNLASGEWILWVDSDNILSKNYIKAAFKEIVQANDNVAVLYPKYSIPIGINKAGKLIACYFNSSIKKQSTNSNSKFLTLPMQGTFTRTSALRFIRGFNSFLIAGEDIDIFMRLISVNFELKSFDAVLYFITRRSITSWVRQAIIWGYGQRMLIKYNGFNSENMKNVISRYHLKNVYSNFIDFIIFVITAFNHCKLAQAAILPYLYIIRRAGYFAGYYLYGL